MRIWMDPDLLQSRGLTPQDVINAIQQQSQEVAAGAGRRAAGAEGPGFPIYARPQRPPGRPRRVREHHRQGRSANGGHITRIRDIGHVELGAQTYSESFNLDGRPASGIAISLLPDANAIAVADEVKAKMDELAKSFPAGLGLCDALRHHEIRQGRDQRGLLDPDRGRRFWC